jgi:hypothetical protein
VPAERAGAIRDAWLKSSRLAFRKRSARVAAVDAALVEWVSDVGGAPGDLAVDERGRAAVEDALAAWRVGKSSSRRMPAADALQRALAGERQRIDDERGYETAGELLADLRASARASINSGWLPEPDLFGLLGPVSAPFFLREGGVLSGAPFDYSRISADELIHFFRLLSMLRAPVPAEMDPRGWTVAVGSYSYSYERSSRQWSPRPEAGLLPSSTVEMPKLVQGSWFGGTLRPTGPSAGAWRRFREAAQSFGDDATFVLFTDRPREALAAVRDLDAAPAREPARSDWYLARWAEDAGISLVNLFEVIAAFGGSRLLPVIQTELAKQTPRGYAAASDSARVFLHRFGGLYTDPDNDIERVDLLRQMGTGQNQDTFAITDTDRGLTNSVMVLIRNHPIVDLEEQMLLANYRLTQTDLMGRADSRYTRTSERIRQNSLVHRSGPGFLEQVIKAAGYTRESVPVTRDIIDVSDLTWLSPPPDTREHRRWSGRETLEFTQKAIHSMVRSLYNREGDLHLTHIKDAVDTHARPDLVWDAAFAFLSERADLRPMLRTVTFSGPKDTEDGEVSTWELIRRLLPPSAADLLQPSNEGHPQARPNGSLLGEQPVAARLLPPARRLRPGGTPAPGYAGEPGGRSGQAGSLLPAGGSPAPDGGWAWPVLAGAGVMERGWAAVKAGRPAGDDGEWSDGEETLAGDGGDRQEGGKTLAGQDPAAGKEAAAGPVPGAGIVPSGASPGPDPGSRAAAIAEVLRFGADGPGRRLNLPDLASEDQLHAIARSGGLASSHEVEALAARIAAAFTDPADGPGGPPAGVALTLVIPAGRTPDSIVSSGQIAQAVATRLKHPVLMNMEEIGAEFKICW